jgi:chromosome segregation ATPase
MNSDWTDFVESMAAKPRATQLQLDLEILSNPPDDHPQNPPRNDRKPIEAIRRINHGSDVDSLPFLLQKQTERIQDLEKALDQSLVSLEELRVQLVDQQLLEHQLAATEEIANIQQRAITQLRQQLVQQHQPSDAQQAQSPQPIETYQRLLSVIEELAAGQQSRLVQLQAQFRNDRLLSALNVQSHAVEQGFIDVHASDAPSSEVADLTRQISNLQHVIEQLETELDRTHRELQDQQARIDQFQQSSLAAHSSPNSPLEQEVFAAHCKIQDLETQISKQITTQAILQHTCQELEQARDRYQIRAAELELQTAEMQEQILKQAQQASEYETAIQHWKDRYVKSQTYLKRLNELVEQSALRPSNELADLLAAIQVMMDIPDPASTIDSPHRAAKMDIPDFLARRHRYRVRS